MEPKGRLCKGLKASNIRVMHELVAGMNALRELDQNENASPEFHGIYMTFLQTMQKTTVEATLNSFDEQLTDPAARIYFENLKKLMAKLQPSACEKLAEMIDLLLTEQKTAEDLLGQLEAAYTEKAKEGDPVLDVQPLWISNFSATWLQAPILAATRPTNGHHEPRKRKEPAIDEQPITNLAHREVVSSSSMKERIIAEKKKFYLFMLTNKKLSEQSRRNIRKVCVLHGWVEA